MRLKSKNLFKVELSEQIFLFVTIMKLNDEKILEERTSITNERIPMVVSKLWTLSRMVDAMKKNLNLDIFKAKNEQVLFKDS